MCPFWAAMEMELAPLEGCGSHFNFNLGFRLDFLAKICRNCWQFYLDFHHTKTMVLWWLRKKTYFWGFLGLMIFISDDEGQQATSVRPRLCGHWRLHGTWQCTWAFEHWAMVHGTIANAHGIWQLFIFRDWWMLMTVDECWWWRFVDTLIRELLFIVYWSAACYWVGSEKDNCKPIMLRNDERHQY